MIGSWKQIGKTEKLLLLGLFSTNLGNALNVLILGKFLFDLTGSAKAFGGVLAIEQFLAVVGSIIAGPLVDRFDPIKTVVRADLYRGLSVVALGTFLYMYQSIYIIYLMIFVIQLGRPFYKAGCFAAEIHLVNEERRLSFNSISVTAVQAGSFIGMWLAGLLIAVTDIRLGFLINGASFIVSSICILFTHADKPYELAGQESLKPLKNLNHYSRHIIQDWIELLKVLHKKKELILALTLSAMDNVLPQLFNVILVPLVFIKLANQGYWLSALDSAYALGAGISGIVIGRLLKKTGIQLGVCGGIGLQGLSFYLLNFFSNQSLLLLACLLFGAANTTSWTGWQTWFQNHLTKSERGKLTVFRHLTGATLTAVAVLLVTQLLGQNFSLALLSICFLGIIAAIFAAILFFVFDKKKLRAMGQVSDLRGGHGD